MASKVNVKFVATLSVVVLLVFLGVAAAAYFVLAKSGAKYERLGDAKMAEGEYGKAAELYERAVGHEKANIAWLSKWRDALRKYTPETQATYQERYDNKYLPVLRQIASVQRTNVRAHHDHLGEWHQRFLLGGGGRDAWQFLISQTDDAVRFFEEGTEGEWNTLRRYRGLARTAIMSAQLDLKPDEVEAAREDLEAALEANPADDEVLASLVQWHLDNARRAGEAGDPEREAASRAALHDVLAGFQRANPRSVGGAVTAFQVAIDDARRSIDPELRPEALHAAMTGAMGALRPRIAEMSATLRAADPAALTYPIMVRFRLAANAVDPRSGAEAAMGVVDHVLRARPDDPNARNLRASLLAEADDFAGAVAEYQKIRDLPGLPLSLEGLVLTQRQQEAVLNQAGMTLNACERAAIRSGDQSLSAEERASARGEMESLLGRAKGYREELTQLMPEASPPLMLVDAKIKRAENDLVGTQKLLEAYNEQTRYGNFEAVALLGEVAQKLNQPGIARQQFQRLVELQPGHIGAKIALAEIETQLQNTDGAIALYEGVLRRDPANAVAAERLPILMAMKGQGVAADPVTNALIEFQRIAAGTKTELGDQAKAEESLAKAVEANNHDPRLVVTLARALFTREEKGAAAELVRRAGALHPESEELRRLQAALEAPDSVVAELTWIDESAGSEVDKLLSKYRVYGKAGRAEEAGSALAAAEKAAPDDVRVLEFSFLRALGADDEVGAQRIVDRVASGNLDRANGLTYRARVEMARGRFAEAVRTLEQVAGQGTATASVYRLLATAQMQLGRGPDAVASYRKALDIRPDDLSTIVAYIRALISLQRYDDALALAQASESYGRGNAEFMDLWLGLEGMVGNKVFAADRREALRERDRGKDDRRNTASLARLYVELGRWESARTLIDELRAAEDSLALAQLDAEWHARRQDIDAARRVFVDYIVGLGADKATSQPYLVFGEFMINKNQPEIGLNALGLARQYQDPKRLEADQVLGNAYFNLGRFAEAKEAYGRVLAILPPGEGADLRNRRIEAMLRLGEFDQAEAEVAKAGAAADSDLTLLLLRADAARGLNDPRRAADLLNRAVTVFPRESLPYLKRAQSMLDDPALRKDALADLNTSLRLRPNSWQALRTRAILLFAMGEEETALEDLAAAAAAGPDQDWLRTSYMEELISRGQEDEAVEVAQAAIRERPGDLGRVVGAGDTLSRLGKWSEAARFYGEAWEQTRGADEALRYLTALLRTEPPDVRRAEAVLQSPGLKVEASPQFLMIRAEVRRQLGRPDLAKRDATSALKLLNPASADVASWFDAMARVLPNNPDRIVYLQELEAGEPGLAWVPFFRARAMLLDEPSRSAAIALLGELADGTDPAIKAAAYRLRGNAHYVDKDFERSADDLRRALEIAPEDVELLNNLAYTLAKHLDKGAEAVPFAERAAAKAPGSASILDTLGTAYHAAGELEKSDEAFVRGLRAATTPSDRATISLHLADVKLARADTAGAARHAGEAQRLLGDHPGLPDSLRTDLKALMERIDSAR